MVEGRCTFGIYLLKLCNLPLLPHNIEYSKLHVILKRPLRSGLYHCAIMALTLADRGEKLHSKTLFLYFVEHFLYSDLCNFTPSIHLQEDFPHISV